MTSIETPRLTLRPLREEDLDDICRIQGDPRVYARMPLEPLTREESRAWLDRCLAVGDGSVGFRAALLRESGAYTGHAGLLPQVVDGVDELEIGYWFAPEYWGRGLATEAACALRDFARETLGRRRLVSMIVPENLPSRRVAERVGMRLERETVWRGHLHCVYALGGGEPPDGVPA